MTDPVGWSPAERELLADLLDELVPARADGRIPAAGAIGVLDFIADRASEDPAPANLVSEALTHVGALVELQPEGFADLTPAGRIATVAALERDRPEAFEALRRCAYMGYYSRADVRPLFGLSNQPTQPPGYDVPAEDPDELAALLAPVRARGSCYRPS